MQDVQRFAQDLCQRVVNMLHLVELAGREVPVKFVQVEHKNVQAAFLVAFDT
jgi:hypothetical protein